MRTNIRQAGAITALFLVAVAGTVAQAHDPIGGTGGPMQRTEVSGTLDREGYPQGDSEKQEAGSGCVVDVSQEHNISGALSGVLEIDYRFLLAGSCESSARMGDEEWIAHGVFEGMVGDSSSTASFSYVGRITDSGDLEGRIVFGGGLDGELRIRGNTRDTELSYRGWIAQDADGAGF